MIPTDALLTLGSREQPLDAELILEAVPCPDHGSHLGLAVEWDGGGVAIHLEPGAADSFGTFLSEWSARSTHR